MAAPRFLQASTRFMVHASAFQRTSVLPCSPFFIMSDGYGALWEIVNDTDRTAHSEITDSNGACMYGGVCIVWMYCARKCACEIVEWTVFFWRRRQKLEPQQSGWNQLLWSDSVGR